MRSTGSAWPATQRFPAGTKSGVVRDELPFLVLFDGWNSFFRDRVVPWRIGLAERVRTQFEQEILPAFLSDAALVRGERTSRCPDVKLSDDAVLNAGRSSWLITLVTVDAAPDPSTYFLPLTLVWDDGDDERLRSLGPAGIAKVRQQAAVGVLADAFADPAFSRSLVEAIAARQELATAQGRIRFTPGAAFAAIAGSDIAGLEIKPVSRPDQQHRGGARPTPVPESLPTRAQRHQPRRRDRAVPHRSRALSQRRSAGWNGRLSRRQTAPPPRSPSCKATSRTRATAGLIPSNTSNAFWKSAVAPKILLPTASTGRISHWCKRWGCGPPSSIALLRCTDGRSGVRSRTDRGRGRGGMEETGAGRSRCDARRSCSSGRPSCRKRYAPKWSSSWLCATRYLQSDRRPPRRPSVSWTQDPLPRRLSSRDRCSCAATIS